MKQTYRSVLTVRQKTNAVRGKGGLVHGTGRVKPYGTIRRSDSNSKKSAPKPVPLEPSKQRLVIEQGPTPLYCSDECRLADLNTSNGFVESDYNPDRQSPPPPPPPVPHNSFSSLAFSVSQDSESDSSSSTDSSVELTDTDRCHACLAPLYGFPPLPPHPPLLRQESSQQKLDDSKQYQSGVTMAAQRINMQGGALRALISTKPFPRNANPSLVGLMALTTGVPRYIPLPSLAITPSPSTRARIPKELRRLLPTPGWCLLDLGCQVPGASALVQQARLPSSQQDRRRTLLQVQPCFRSSLRVSYLDALFLLRPLDGSFTTDHHCAHCQEEGSPHLEEGCRGQAPRPDVKLKTFHPGGYSSFRSAIPALRRKTPSPSILIISNPHDPSIYTVSRV